MANNGSAPTLLRRAAPAPVATTAADQLLPLACSASPTSPRFPPGFPLPQFARSDLVVSLFPQLAGISSDLRVRVAAPASAARAAVPDVPALSPKVRFAANAALLEGTPPPPIQGAHRPCLKSAPASVFKSLRDANSSPTHPAVDPRQSSPAVDSQDDGWRLVRPPYWWREARSNNQHPRHRAAPSFFLPRQRDFVKHKDRSCHRCLLKGHCKADCRNPFTCLRCRRIGHRARDCTNPPLPSSVPRSASPFDGQTRPRVRQEQAPRRRDDNVRHRRDDGRVRVGLGKEDRRGREGDRRSSSSKVRLFGNRSCTLEHHAVQGRKDAHHDGRDNRGGVPASHEATKVAPAQVQGLSCNAVSPASGRKGWHAEACTDRHLEDRREGLSPPASPRTTFEDIIEIHPTSPPPGWPRLAAPCFGAKDRHSPRSAPPPASCCQFQEGRDEPATPVTSSTGDIIVTPSTSSSSPTFTPIFLPRTPTSSPQRTPIARRKASCFESQVPPSAIIDFEPVIASPDPCPAQDAATPVRVLPAGDHNSATARSPLFVPLQPALLPAPSSTPPRRPTARRKTLAGITGFNLGRRSPRLREKMRDVPIAQLAERLLCQRLGIVAEGEQLTEAAINKFVSLFHGRLPDITIAALRALFHLDCDLLTAVEDALLQHGGEDGPDLQTQGNEDAAVTAAT